MAEEKVTFLTEVELPPYCFVSEAIEWIAYGRVPQMQHHDAYETNETVDYRFHWGEMPDNFQPVSEYPWFDRLEFESLGLQMSDDYPKAAEKCLEENVRNLPRRIKEYEMKDDLYIERDDGTVLKFYEKIIAECRSTLNELGPLQELVDHEERKFRPFFEIACAKLFQLLASGQIVAEALDFDRWTRFIDEGDYESGARFVSVPLEAFSLSLDWSLNEILINGVQHVALRVRTQDILDHRSMLLQSGKPITVERFGAFYLSSNRARVAKGSQRGRGKMVDWQILKDHLAALALERNTPDGKENCIYELIAFAEKELGKSPSRTAVQRNLSEELDAIYARN